jgi:serine/threonine protein kinase
MSKGEAIASVNSELTSAAAAVDLQRQVANGDLSQWMSSDPALPELVTPTFLRVVTAVQKSHQEDKRLCDLDPRKVLFQENGNIKLSFLNPVVPGATVILSSLKYLAPELMREGIEQLDHNRTDSYVLGFVFYEIFLGKALFDQHFSNVSEQGHFGWLAWHADTTRPAKPLRDVIPDFPSVLSGLISGMMAKDASQRVTDMGRIADVIRGASQATAVIRHLPSLSAGDKVRAELKALAPRETETLWRKLLSRVFNRSHRTPPPKVSSDQEKLVS